MKIGVLVKQVPDTETKIRVKADASGIETDGIKYVMNPYDEVAVEAALQVKEKNAGSEVTVISLGPDRSVETIRTALAMGADKAVHIDSADQELDSFQTATALAKVIKDQGFEAIFTGKQAIDGDAGQVTQLVAELLDWPQVMVAESLELNGDTATIGRKVSGGSKEVYEINAPFIVGCEVGLNTPRYASLPGIMKAKRKPVDKIALADALAGAEARVTSSNFRLPPEKPAGRVIEGDLAQSIPELVRLLREEAKVI